MKLLVYGYLNRIRSSRCLERECHCNIEVMWLLGQLAPDHNTFASFRKHKAKAITRVFRATVKLARHFNLIGGELLAGDSTKLRAQNSKKHKSTGARSPATWPTSSRSSGIASWLTVRPL
ncbi:hypothetical protein PKOR_00510 [Pontibacter korlensis]|uniref:Transposase InsH N-terminal domain-containing protein n=1 Tax=Pontibacter korlensis TaxID=400092 RepID=A0A0E3UVK5_9BACT|nr:hypothetical protein PKOR_00510 [Pontibacter korlensis]